MTRSCPRSAEHSAPCDRGSALELFWSMPCNPVRSKKHLLPMGLFDCIALHVWACLAMHPKLWSIRESTSTGCLCCLLVPLQGFELLH